MPVVAAGGLEARFDLGNSSSVRKRISVLILESDFSDLSVCTFWLGPNAPLRAYRMRTHTTTAWTNASIYFYAASAGANGGAYQIDNVSLHQDPAVSSERTECVDPTAPAATSGVDGPSLLSNGDFGSGLSPWGLFGQIVQQIAGGVFEFYRPAGTPAGVVLQNTGQPAAANEILTATFELGNSSAVKKRVTILLHDNDFTDLMACTFWLPPGVPLSPYAVRGFATKAWTAATVSVYPATVGAEQWIRLDNVALRRTPSAAVIGVECLEPGAAVLLPPPSATSSSGANGAPVVAAAAAVPAAVRPLAGRPRPDGEASEVRVLERIDLRDATRAQVTVRSWLPAGASGVEVQVSRDGVTWLTVAVLIGSDDWASWIIDLQDFLGEVIQIRLVFPA